MPPGIHYQKNEHHEAQNEEDNRSGFIFPQGPKVFENFVEIHSNEAYTESRELGIVLWSLRADSMPTRSHLQPEV